MKKLTKRLLVFTAAIAMLTATVSAANAPYAKTIELGKSYTTAENMKDDSEGKAYVTSKSTGSVPDQYNAFSAVVLGPYDEVLTGTLYLKYNTRHTANYKAGCNDAGSYNRLKITYFANPALVPPSAYVSGVWCP